MRGGEEVNTYLLMHAIHAARHLRVGGGAAVVGATATPVTATELRIAEVARADAVLSVRVTSASITIVVI